MKWKKTLTNVHMAVKPRTLQNSWSPEVFGSSRARSTCRSRAGAGSARCTIRVGEAEVRCPRERVEDEHAPSRRRPGVSMAYANHQRPKPFRSAPGRTVSPPPTRDGHRRREDSDPSRSLRQTLQRPLVATTCDDHVVGEELRLPGGRCEHARLGRGRLAAQYLLHVRARSRCRSGRPPGARAGPSRPSSAAGTPR